jgi:hypothetical protein
MMRVSSWADVDRAIRALETIRTGKPLVDGHEVRDVDLVSGAYTKVPHKLGRRVQGYIVTGRSADATVYDNHTSQLDLNSNLSLRASAAVTVNLWVY